MSIYGQPTGGFGMPKTFVITDNSGNEITGVVVGEKAVFTAGLNDIRAGKVAANEEGVVTGTKDIPGYRTTQGVAAVKANSEFIISSLAQYNQYDYTKLQCIIAPFNTDVDSSVSSDKIVLNDSVYETNSSVVLATVSKDVENKSIKLNITNNTENLYVIHYFTYREEE